MVGKQLLSMPAREANILHPPLAPQSSHNLARLVGEIPDDFHAKQRGRMRGGCKLFASLVSTRNTSLPTKATAFLFAFAPEPTESSPTNHRASLRQLVGARRMQTICPSGYHSPSSSLLCTGAIRDLSNQSSKLVGCDWSLVRVWMQTVCLSSRHSQKLLANKGCHLPLCFAPEPQWISPTSHRASLRLIVGARRMQTVCLSGQHSPELLAN